METPDSNTQAYVKEFVENASENGNNNVFNFFFGSYTSIAPNAQNLTNYYGKDVMVQPAGPNESAAIMNMSAEEKRLFVYLGSSDKVKALVSVLQSLQSVDELARVIISMVREQTVRAEESRTEKFIQMLLLFCTELKDQHPNSKKVREHMNRLLKKTCGDEEVKKLKNELEKGE